MRRALVLVLVAACSPPMSPTDGGSTDTDAGATDTDGGATQSDGGATDAGADAGLPRPGRLFGVTIGGGRADLLELTADGGISAPAAQHPVGGVSWALTHDPFTHSVGLVSSDRAGGLTTRYVRLWPDGGSAESAPMDTELNWSGGIHVRADGQVVGVAFVSDAGEEQLRTFDPVTGASQRVAGIPNVAFIARSSPTIDATRRIVWFIGDDRSAASRQLFRVDAFDGGSSRSGPLADFFLTGVRKDGLGLALVSGGDAGFTLSTLDPATAQLTPLRPAAVTPPLSDSVYDPIDERLYFHSVETLVVLDGTTGAELARYSTRVPGNRTWVGFAVMRP